MGFGGDKIFGSNLSLGQFEFMAEAESQDNLVDTPDSRFNAALIEIQNELGWAKGLDTDITERVDGILQCHGINPAFLSPEQVLNIQLIVF